MKVQYSTTLDDLVALHQHQWRKSASSRRKQILENWVVPAIFFFVFAYLVARPESITPWYIAANLGVFLLFAAVFVPLSRFLRMRSLRRTLEATYTNAENRGVLGKHLLEINERGIVETNAVGRNIHTWEGIDRIEVTQDYIFVVASAGHVHVIPRRAFNFGVDSDIFLMTAETFMKKAHEKAAAKQPIEFPQEAQASR